MINIVIADDSSTVRFILKKIFSTDPNIKVIGEATNGQEAINLCKELKPNLVTMDIRMPIKNGFEATTEIMQKCPTPILVISSSVQDEDLNITFNAIKAGALDIIEKPKGNLSLDFEKLGVKIIRKIKILSEVKVITKRNIDLRKIDSSLEVKDKFKSKLFQPSFKENYNIKLVAIVSSTGGPKALLTLLKEIPKNFPVPIVIVQHITTGFGAGLVHWLDKECDISIKFPVMGEKIVPGTVYFAPDDYHMRINIDLTVKLSKEAEVVGLRPYGNYLISSLANILGDNVLGVILTGMGRDGVDGLKQLSDLGAFTIGQDEETSVIYGMPREAFEAGAISVQLPIELIAEQIKKIVIK